MASFTGQLIKDTYDSILKAIDNGVIDSTAKNITDGVGNVTPLYISTTQVGIGVTPSTDFHVNGSALIGGSLTITGDLTVNGSTTTISTQTLSVEDPLIILAKDNAANSVDIGFYGKYVDGSTKYAGLFRKAGDNKFHIFSGLGTEPTTTVNTSDASYVISTLVGNLEGNVTGNIIATGAGATQIMSDVRAVTQSANDNSTKIATTAYVDSALGGQDTLAEILANGNTTGGTDISVSANDDITFTDSSKAIFDGNLKIYNDGNYNYIHCTSNELRIRSNNLRLLNSAGTANYITADNLQAVQLYYNNSKKLETTSTGVTVTGAVSATTFSGQLDGTISSATTAVTQSDGDNSTKVATTAYVDTAIQGHDTLAEVLVGGNTTGGTDIAVSSGDDITFADSSKTIYGAGSDLSIYSDGTDGYVIANVDDLVLRSADDIFMEVNSGANAIKAVGGAAVELYYNNSKKFETTSSGIEVTGDGIFGGSSFDDPNSYGRKIEIVDNDAVGLILNDTRDTNPMSIDNSGAVMNLRYNTTSMLALDGATSNATFAGDVIVPEYIKHSGDEDTSIRFTTNNIKFYTANNEVLELEDDGQVNIISAGTVTNPCLTIGDDVNTGIWRPASDTFAISTGGNERMRIDSGGDVGIGVNSPSTKLEVLSSQSNSSIRTGGLEMQSYAVNNSWYAENLYYDGAWKLRSNGHATQMYMEAGVISFKRVASGSAGDSVSPLTTMVLNSDGNVGIGTTSPQSKLHISTSTTNAPIRLQNDNGSGSTANYVLQTDSSGLGNNGFGIYDVAQSAYRFVIDGSGNVGIGTTSPRNDANFVTLQVGSTATAASQIVLDDNDSNGPWRIISNQSLIINDDATERMRIDSSGNVCINNTSVTGYNENFNVTGQGIVTENTNGGNRGIFGFFGGTPLLIGTGDGVDVVFRTDNTERMRINSSGNVGIGTTSPTQKLHVASGHIRLDSGYALLWDDSHERIEQQDGHLEFFINNGQAMTLNTNGLGIGTTNPQNKFVVKEGSNVDMEFGSEADGCFIQTYNRTTSSWGYLRFIAGGGERMRITRVGGEVLINQTSDLTGQIFQVNGMIDQTDVTKALRVYNGSTFLGGIGSGQWAISATYANDYALYAQNNLLFHAGTGSSIDMMIDANHNVGIATTSPTALLDVSSGTTTDVIRFGANSRWGFSRANSDNRYLSFMRNQNASGTAVWTVDGDNGNVAIGTTYPAAITSNVSAITLGGTNGSVSGGVMYQFNGNNAASHYYESSNFRYQNVGNYDHTFYTSNTTQRFQINTNGWSYFNNQGTGGGIEINGTSGKYLDIYCNASIAAFSTNASSFYFNTNVGIGTTSPSAPLTVHGQQKWYTTSADGNELRGFFNPGGSGDDAELSLYIADGATEGIVWRAAGNSYIRIDSTSLKFINFYYGSSNVGQIVTGGTNVLYQSNSDYRLKENVVEMTGALDRVEQLKPSTYNFISQPETQVDGFMAHELQEVVPQAVSGEKDEMNEDGTPKYQGVDHSQIVPLLVGAIKELKAEIETLKAQINN